MLITAATTNEEILANVQHSTKRLGELAAAGAPWEVLAAAANDVAEAQGEAEAYYLYRDMLASDNSSETILRTLLIRANNGADDQWSGRLNDARRSKFDGFRKAVAEIQWSLR